MKVSCVVVTYNRKESLQTCLSAICSQDTKPVKVFIIDNASNDGTDELVRSMGFDKGGHDGIMFNYIRLPENTGGAGGFNYGLKLASCEEDSDAFWLMDDDGIPDMKCLSSMIPFLSNYDYIAPVVLSDENHRNCSFVEGHIDYGDFIKRANNNGLIYDYASPFNGVLFSKKLISTIGFPKKEMFIWGDELEFHNRARKNGFIPVTVASAIHYHPIDRQRYIEIKPNLYYAYAEDDWKQYCLVRNKTYISIRYGERGKLREIIASFHVAINYNKFYHSHKKEGRMRLLIDAVVSGIIGDFSGTFRYK